MHKIDLLISKRDQQSEAIFRILFTEKDYGSDYMDNRKVKNVKKIAFEMWRYI